MTPVGVAGSSAGIVAGKVFFPNAAVDTDYLIAPLSTGAETFAVLRSAQSPQSLALRFSMPAGATLRAGPGDSSAVQVVRGADLLAEIAKPSAADADGKVVPLTVGINGATMTIRVPHAAGDYAYPIVVDPTITVDFGHWRYNPSFTNNDLAGWQTWSNRPFATFYFDSHVADLPSWGNGLFTFMRWSANRSDYYFNWDVGEWLFQAPGMSYITRATYFDGGNQNGSACAYEGVFSWRANGWEPQVYEGSADQGRIYRGFAPVGSSAPWWSCGTTPNGPTSNWRQFCIDYNCADTAGDASNYAVFGTQIPGPTQNSYFTSTLGGATVVIGDRDDPSVTTPTLPPSPATSDTDRIDVQASDVGLGMKRLYLHEPGNPSWSGQYDNASPCTGDRFSGCPRSLTIASQVGNLSDGPHTIAVEAWDVVGHYSRTDLAVNVQRMPRVNLPPSVQGVAQVGVALSGSGGTWLGALPLNVSLQWQRCRGLYSDQVQDDSPVGYWRFGEDSGETVVGDFSGNDSSGSASNSAQLGVPGAVFEDDDTALRANGSDNGIAIADTTGALEVGDRFTLEAWIKPSVPLKWSTIFDKGDGGFALRLGADGRIALEKVNGGNIVTSTATVATDGAFHHVVATKDGPAVFLYLDGRDVTGSITNLAISNTTSALQIARSSSSDSYFGGSIDEAAVYSSALSSARVRAHFDEGSSGCVDIADATGAEYLPTEDDISSPLRLKATASNAFGTSSAVSTRTDVVSEALPRVAIATRCPPGFDQVGQDMYGSVRCVHTRPDPVASEMAAAADEDAGVVPDTNYCAEGGKSGYRIVVLYAWKAGQKHFNRMRIAAIRKKVGYANAYLARSSSTRIQHYRMYCTQGSISVFPLKRAVPDTGGDGRISLVEVANEVRREGRALMNRDYLIFLDGVCADTQTELSRDCRASAFDPPSAGGSADLVSDDGIAPGGRGGRNAVIAQWLASTVEHEVGHVLGAVQASAPHATTAGHCQDPTNGQTHGDVMCYDDGSGLSSGATSTMRCQSLPSWNFDCFNDDYWDPVRPSGNAYLSTHWNTADSVFLTPPASRP